MRRAPCIAATRRGHPEDALEEKSHAKDLADACRTALIEVAEDGLYSEFWSGLGAPGRRKWFFQDALCKTPGRPCYSGHDEL